MEAQPYRVGDTTNGQLVQMNQLPAQARPLVSSDLLFRMAYTGKIFVACDAGDQNDTVTGQTSFAATTPTFLLRVPEGRTAIPLFLNLSQAGTVAGGAIEVIIEADFDDRYSTGGTSEKVKGMKKGTAALSTVYSNPTARAGFGVRLWGAFIGPDVSTAEGAVPGPFWKPEVPMLLEGPASLLVFTSATATGPTWIWSLGFAEIPTDQLAQWFDY